MKTPAQDLRESAARHERQGRPVMALLMRNEAYKLEHEFGDALAYRNPVAAQFVAAPDGPDNPAQIEEAA